MIQAVILVPKLDEDVELFVRDNMRAIREEPAPTDIDVVICLTGLDDDHQLLFTQLANEAGYGQTAWAIYPSADVDGSTGYHGWMARDRTCLFTVMRDYADQLGFKTVSVTEVSPTVN